MKRKSDLDGVPGDLIETADEPTVTIVDRAEAKEYLDHPELTTVLQDLADSYARWQVYPIPPGLEYVEVELEEGEEEPPLPLSPIVRAIVTAVGPDFVPAELDEGQLHRSIHESVDIYFEALKARSKKDRTEQMDEIDRLKRICEDAQRLADGLKPEEAWDWTGESYLEQLKDLIRRKKSEIEDLDLEIELSEVGQDLRRCIVSAVHSTCWLACFCREFSKNTSDTHQRSWKPVRMSVLPRRC